MDEAIRTILEQRLIAVIRLDDVDRDILPIAQALQAGGVRVLEITLTSGSAPAALERLCAWTRTTAGQDVTVGVGSVRHAEEARAAVDAGASFIVSPGLVPGILEQRAALGAPIIPGILTPSEAMAAHELGADAIKLFPASLGGPTYLKNLLAPLPDLELIPTGGITLDAIPAYLAAGAAAVGLGSALIPPETIARRNWDELRQRAHQAVHQAHGQT